MPIRTAVVACAAAVVAFVVAAGEADVAAVDGEAAAVAAVAGALGAMLFCDEVAGAALHAASIAPKPMIEINRRI
jgi:hypothetical protein